MKIPFAKEDFSALACPNCGEESLHHESVEIFERREDAPRGLLVQVATGSKEDHIAGSRTVQVHADKSMKRCPSLRRGGLRIRFWCETCHPDEPSPTLAIVQHKGGTFLYWEED